MESAECIGSFTYRSSTTMFLNGGYTVWADLLHAANPEVLLSRKLPPAAERLRPTLKNTSSVASEGCPKQRHPGSRIAAAACCVYSWAYAVGRARKSDWREASVTY